MIKLFITISLVLIWYFSGAQRGDTLLYDNIMITYIEDAPLFWGNLKDFIRKQVKYPEEAQTDSLEGTVFISF
jgi:hypothetical protein